MNGRIWILAFSTFAVGTESYVFSGLLERLAADLSVSVAVAGQLTSSFAITYALTAPFMAAAFARVDRKKVLVSALFLLGFLNMAASFAPSFEALMGVRIACGVVATLVTPIASAAAASLAPPEKRGMALAAVLGGVTVAFMIGIPMGSVVGDAFGWRHCFSFAGLLAFTACVAISLFLPNAPSADRGGVGALSVIASPRIMVNLAYTAIAFCALFTMATFIGPVVTQATGLSGGGIGAMQAFVGFGSILGVAAGGWLAGRAPGNRVIGAIFIWIVCTLSLYSLWMSGLLGLTGLTAQIVLAATIFTGAAGMFAFTPIVQARLITAAPEARNVAMAMNGSMLFLGQGLGAAFGGLVVSTIGLTYVGLAGGLLAGIGVALAFFAAGSRSLRLQG